MPAPALALFIDFESSGLLTDPQPPTLLEGSWTVTDTRGTQRTPLAQAFCALPTSPQQHAHVTPVEFGFGLTTPVLADGTDGQPVAGWTGQYPRDVVMEMHHDNGLALEWAQMDAGPDRGRILRHWQEVERLLLDDLDSAGWRGLDRGQVLLAGGGVSHYEDRFLRWACPRVFGDPRVHYSTGCDVSTVLRTLRTRALAVSGEDEEGGFPGTADRLIERYRPDMYSRDNDTSWADIRLDPGRYDAADRCGYSRGVGIDGIVWEKATEHWAVVEKDNHRAAPGIARALMAYRLLPRLFADSFYTYSPDSPVPTMTVPPSSAEV